MDFQQRFDKGEVIEFENPTLVLASASPYRAPILENHGIWYIKILADTNEAKLQKAYKHKDIDLDYAKNYTASLALEKQKPFQNRIKNGAVITCDTVIWCNSQIIEKPLTKEKCREHHLLLSGKTNYAITAIAVTYNNKTLCGIKVSPNKVAKLPEKIIEEICNEPETLNTAGYRIGGVFGKYCNINKTDMQNVIGLDVPLLLSILKKLGFN